MVASDGIHSLSGELFYTKTPRFCTATDLRRRRAALHGFRVLYSVCPGLLKPLKGSERLRKRSSKPIRPEPKVARIHWSEAEGQGYGVMDLTAGRGERRHDMCIVILRGPEAENAKWDSTIAALRRS